VQLAKKRVGKIEKGSKRAVRNPLKGGRFKKLKTESSRKTPPSSSMGNRAPDKRDPDL